MRFSKAVPITELKAWGKNPRKHADDIESLVRSIEHFGWTNPILVQDTTNRIIAGHGRLEAARQSGLDSVPVIFLEMDDHDAAAYTVADNKLAELSTWDDAALGAVLAELHGEHYDMSLMGFSDAEINDRLTRETQALARTELDNIPDRPKKATTRQGDLWELGDHRLLCGDSTNAAQVARAICATRADLVFTDPPYGVAYVGKTADAMTLSNDNLGDEGTRALVADAARVWPLKAGGVFYVCSPAGDQETAFRLALRDAGLTLRQCLVWVKQHFVMGRQDYHWRHESILYGWAEGAAHYFSEDRTQDTVLDEEPRLQHLGKLELIDLIKAYRRREHTTAWREDRPTASLLHPTTKPIALVEKAVRNSSRPGELVFDGFGGSGSTLIAADHSDRTSVLMETDPRYCDVIVERWQTTSGGKAQRVLS